MGQDCCRKIQNWPGGSLVVQIGWNIRLCEGDDVATWEIFTENWLLGSVILVVSDHLLNEEKNKLTGLLGLGTPFYVLSNGQAVRTPFRGE